MAASDAKGIRFKICGIKITVIISNAPCTIADTFDFAPAFIFAELLTITCVIGNPPIKPEIIFPTPCAFSSRFVPDLYYNESSLSVASTLKSVSKLPIKAIVMAIT